MSPEQFAGLLQELTASFGDRPIAGELRRQVEALAGNGLAPASVAIATRCGRALVEANRLDDAQRLFAAVDALFPQQPTGPVGLAHVATRRGAWVEAVQRWDACMRRFPHLVQADWTAAQARAVAGVGPTAVGEPALTEPDPAPSKPTITYGPRVDAFATAVTTFKNLLRADRIGDARAAYGGAFAMATESGHFRALHMVIGPLFEGWERTSALLHLRKVLAERAMTFSTESKREAAAVELRICLSLRDYVGFAEKFARATAERPLSAEDAVLVSIADKVRDHNFPDFDAEKVFGIGLSKTGTTSFIAALEVLKFSGMHWTNPATHDLFSDDDAFLFDAFADLPTCEHFEQFYYTFPNARFVYTIREFDSWKRSYLAQVHAASDAGFGARRLKTMRADSVPWGTRNARLSFGMYYNYSSIDEAFQAYDRRVRRFFADKPANRFLEFSLSDGHGWPELCGFLDRPVPTTPYPRRNPQKAASAA